ncbi:unnamed protein product [Symbiodinium sp. CCMP2592]|nr:unnamed protein product [Symbiodinium sp. CCMP2592]
MWMSCLSQRVSGHSWAGRSCRESRGGLAQSQSPERKVVPCSRWWAKQALLAALLLEVCERHSFMLMLLLVAAAAAALLRSCGADARRLAWHLLRTRQPNAKLYRQASAFCSSYGAIEVREVLEDEELCEEFARHLNLRPLELKRFTSVAAEVRADPGIELVDAEELPEEAESAESPADEVPSAEHHSFRTSGWNSKRGIRSARGGRGRGGLGHYFDSVASDDRDVRGGRAGAGHYFDSVASDDRDVGGGTHAAQRSHAANPYFSSQVGESSPGEDVCESCGSRNVGRHMCFDCGAERAPPAREAAASRRGGASTPSAQAGKAVGKSAATASTPKRRFCINCGSQQLPHAKFCSECGSRMDEPAQRQSEPSYAGEAQRVAAETRPGGLRPGGGGSGHYFEAEAQEPSDPSHPSLAELRAEALAGPPKERGIGAYIRSVEGELWGRVVADTGRTWKLASGRSAKKENEGRAWNFDPDPSRRDQPRSAPSRRADEAMCSAGRKTSVLDELAEKKRHDEEALAAKREAARQRRRAQDQPAAERRVDPDDNKAYTWEELRQRYLGMFSDVELTEYWDKDCKPTRPAAGAPKRDVPERAPRKAAERRRDPDDGHGYSFDELLKKYRSAFSLAEIEEYWLEECQPCS